MTISWVRPPSVLGDGGRRYAELLETGAGRVAVEESINAQTNMRHDRPWRDVSGNARRGLRSEVEQSQGKITLYFVHSVEYGVYLELARGGRYQVIRPEMRATGDRIKKRLPEVGR